MVCEKCTYHIYKRLMVVSMCAVGEGRILGDSKHRANSSILLFSGIVGLFMVWLSSTFCEIYYRWEEAW